MEDSFHTIARESRTEIKVKGSRFIGETFLAHDVSSALEKLQAVRKREFQATHHCYAYVTGQTDEVEFKYSDDGEPNGTAGRPIYDVLVGNGLTNALVVVTRYFGGTKLGTGGLVRAYSDAARAALEISGKREVLITDDFRTTLEFSLYDRWVRELKRLDGDVVDSEFADTVTLQVRIRRSRSERLTAAFVELTAGKGKIEKIESQE